MFEALLKNQTISDYIVLYPKSQWRRCIESTLVYGINRLQTEQPNFITLDQLEDLAANAGKFENQIPGIQTKLMSMRSELDRLNQTIVEQSQTGTPSKNNTSQPKSRSSSVPRSRRKRDTSPTQTRRMKSPTNAMVKPKPQQRSEQRQTTRAIPKYLKDVHSKIRDDVQKDQAHYRHRQSQNRETVKRSSSKKQQIERDIQRQIAAKENETRRAQYYEVPKPPKYQERTQDRRQLPPQHTPPPAPAAPSNPIFSYHKDQDLQPMQDIMGTGAFKNMENVQPPTLQNSLKVKNQHMGKTPSLSEVDKQPTTSQFKLQAPAFEIDFQTPRYPDMQSATHEDSDPRQSLPVGLHMNHDEDGFTSPEQETGELLNIAEDFLKDPLMMHLSTSPAIYSPRTFHSNQESPEHKIVQSEDLNAKREVFQHHMQISELSMEDSSIASFYPSNKIAESVPTTVFGSMDVKNPSDYGIYGHRPMDTPSPNLSLYDDEIFNK